MASGVGQTGRKSLHEFLGPLTRVHHCSEHADHFEDPGDGALVEGVHLDPAANEIGNDTRLEVASLAVIFRTISIKASITGGKKRGEYAPDVVTSGRPFCHRCGSILQLLEQITLIACSTPPDAAPTRSLLKASNRRSTCTRALSSRTASR